MAYSLNVSTRCELLFYPGSCQAWVGACPGGKKFNSRTYLTKETDNLCPFYISERDKLAKKIAEMMPVPK